MQMTALFITLRFLDIIDILLFAILLYQVFKLIKGTAAIGIFAGVFSLYLVWLFVRALNMHLLSSILGQFIGVGVIALIIVFQPELRKGLLLLGNRNLSKNRYSFLRHFSGSAGMQYQVNIDALAEAAFEMSVNKTGALIVIQKIDELENFLQFKDFLNADTSKPLLLSVFQKNSPLHDGAVVVIGSKIIAARTILPLSEKNFVENFGTRHRAAIGISELTDAIVLVVSEETGQVSLVQGGKIKTGLSYRRLMNALIAEFSYENKEEQSFIEKWFYPKSSN